MDLKIKEGKTKFMKVTVNPTNTKCFKDGNHTFGKASEFKYLILLPVTTVSTEVH